MNVEDAILGRRAIRKFSNDEIKQEILDKILEAGVWAPSAGNSQARVFVLVTDQESISQIRNFSPGMSGIPPVIVVMGTDLTKAKEGSGGDWEIPSIMDVATAAENMMLRAYDLGIGSCPVLSFDKERIKEILSVKPETTLNLLVTFGIPAYVGEAPRRTTAQIFYQNMENKYEGAIKQSITSAIRDKGTSSPETIKNLISFSIYSAKSLSTEPPDYAVFRLIEIAGRLLDSYTAPEEIKNFKDLKERLDRIRFGKMIPSKELTEEVWAMAKLL
jgi:nitroreductase